MNCTHCGILLDDDAAFCPNCGSPVGSVAPQANSSVEVINSNEAIGQAAPWTSANAAHRSRRTEVILYGLLGVALVAIVGVWFVLVNPLGLGGAEREPYSEVEPPSTTAVVITPQTPDEPDEEEAPEHTVTPKAALDMYSWEELGHIAKELEAASSRGEAISIAHDYNLVSDTGKMLHSTKHVELGDNMEANFILVDIWADDLSDGSGKAGMTFMSEEPITLHEMNKTNSNSGGWASSEMRSWLPTLTAGLPSELDGVVVSVSKYTNNIGNTTSINAVSATQDRYWIPSFVEIGGPASWRWDSDPANTNNYNAILNAEGAQYAYFAEQNIANEQANAILSMTGSDHAWKWWLRSPSSSNNRRFRAVSVDGDPSYPADSNEKNGVVLGFCL